MSKSGDYGNKGRTNLFTFDPEDLKLITDPKRKLYDKRAMDPINEKFVANVKAHGVIEPIVFWKNPETGDIEVIAGRRRTLALREANKQIKKENGEPFQISGVLRRATSEDQLVAIMVIENEIREADTPSNRAMKLQHLINMGKTEDELAVIIGQSKGTVKNTLAVLECTGKIREAVDAGQLPVSHAYELAKLHPSEQNAKLDEILKETGGSTKLVRNGRGRKVKEIVRGRPSMQGKKDIKKKLEWVEKSEDLKPREKEIFTAVLQWVLGDGRALKSTFAR